MTATCFLDGTATSENMATNAGTALPPPVLGSGGGRFTAAGRVVVGASVVVGAAVLINDLLSIMKHESQLGFSATPIDDGGRAQHGR